MVGDEIMKVDLSGDEALKIANAVKYETFKQEMVKKQVNHIPSFWQLLPFYLLLCLVIGTILVLIYEGSKYAIIQ